MDKEYLGITKLFLVALAIAFGWSIIGIILKVNSSIITLIATLSFVVFLINGIFYLHLSKLIKELKELCQKTQ